MVKTQSKKASYLKWVIIAAVVIIDMLPLK